MWRASSIARSSAAERLDRAQRNGAAAAYPSVNSTASPSSSRSRLARAPGAGRRTHGLRDLAAHGAVRAAARRTAPRTARRGRSRGRAARRAVRAGGRPPAATGGPRCRDRPRSDDLRAQQVDPGAGRPRRGAAAATAVRRPTPPRRRPRWPSPGRRRATASIPRAGSGVSADGRSRKAADGGQPAGASARVRRALELGGDRPRRCPPRPGPGARPCGRRSRPGPSTSARAAWTSRRSRRRRRPVDGRADERMPEPDPVVQLDQPGRLGAAAPRSRCPGARPRRHNRSTSPTGSAAATSSSCRVASAAAASGARTLLEAADDRGRPPASGPRRRPAPSRSVPGQLQERQRVAVGSRPGRGPAPGVERRRARPTPAGPPRRRCAAAHDQCPAASSTGSRRPYADGEDHGQRLRPEPTGDELQRLRRGPVQPLRVVHHADQGLLLGDHAEQVQHRQAEQKAIRRAPDRNRRRCRERPAAGRAAARAGPGYGRTAGAGRRRRAPSPTRRRPPGRPAAGGAARPGTPAALSCRFRPRRAAPGPGCGPPSPRRRDGSAPRTRCGVRRDDSRRTARGLRQDASCSSRREPMPSLVNTLRRCHSTVLALRKSCPPISALESPSEASRAMLSSCAVRSGRPCRAGAVAGAPADCSRRRARSAKPRIPMAVNIRCAAPQLLARLGAAAARPSHSPYSRCVRASSPRTCDRPSRSTASWKAFSAGSPSASRARERASIPRAQSVPAARVLALSRRRASSARSRSPVRAAASTSSTRPQLCADQLAVVRARVPRRRERLVYPAQALGEHGAGVFGRGDADALASGTRLAGGCSMSAAASASRPRQAASTMPPYGASAIPASCTHLVSRPAVRRPRPARRAERGPWSGS